MTRQFFPAMSLKTRLQLSIVALVVIVVTPLSLINVHNVIDTRFEDSLERATTAAGQVESFILQLVDQQTALRDPQPRDLEEVKTVWTEIVEQNEALASLLEKVMGSSQVIVETVVTDENDRILTGSLASRRGQKLPPLPSLEDFQKKSLWAKLDEVLFQTQDYEVAKPLGTQGRPEAVFRVRVIISSVLLRGQVMPQLQDLGMLSALALLLSILLAVMASKIAFRPLARIGDRIDRIARGEIEAAQIPTRGQVKEVAAVESKLNLLGQQFRGARTDALELRANIDQLLDRMEEAVLLFGRDDRLVMAGSAAERLLGIGRWEMMGKSLDDVFSGDTVLGAMVQSAVQLRRAVKDRPILFEQPGTSPVRLLVSVELIEEFPRHDRIGTLVTLRDADPRHQIESRLDVSTRLAAISQLTSGAAHEIKNPLNSIALHLEVLKSKLDGIRPDDLPEIDVIAREITRLDRVVKTFLDFARPIELKLEEVDLAKLVEEVASLVTPTAARQGVMIATTTPSEPALMQADHDLLKQAVLNVVANGVEAMKGGGQMEVSLRENLGRWLITVRDQGVGIPADAHDQIYQLYFTTKGKGSGIGLAMTFRVVQLHSGTIDFTSEPGNGTEFRLEFPAAQENRRQPAVPTATGASDA